MLEARAIEDGVAVETTELFHLPVQASHPLDELPPRRARRRIFPRHPQLGEFRRHEGVRETETGGAHPGASPALVRSVVEVHGDLSAESTDLFSGTVQSGPVVDAEESAEILVGPSFEELPGGSDGGSIGGEGERATRGAASDPYALHLGDGGAGTLDQGVDGPTGLRHQPLQVRDRGDAGGVEDIGTDVAEGAQPGDRVVEVVDPVEV